MTGTINQIRSWAATELKYWEQAALERIVERDVPTEEDYEELVEYFEQDAGLVPLPAARPELSFPALGSMEATPEVCRLVRLFNLRNVNALPEGQEIRFGAQLTLVYGNNGAGKTGYTRPLGCAGFARGDRDVLPNAMLAGVQPQPRADIEVSHGPVIQSICWTRGVHRPELARFYVFDGNSAIAHLTQANAIGFAPAGLSLLTRLAEVTDQVRRRIRVLINEKERPHNLEVSFEGSSDIKTVVANLDLQTNFDGLEELSKLSPTEEVDATVLETEIAKLKLMDVPKHIEKRQREIGDIQNLLSLVERAREALGERAESTLNQIIDSVRLSRTELAESGASQFLFDPFTQIGSPVWLGFLFAAKALAEAESWSFKLEAPCLLCRQPLSIGAAALIERLWAFLASDSQSRLEAAERARADEIQRLERVDLNFFGSGASARRLLEQDLPVIIPAIEAQIDACDQRRRECVESLRSVKMRALPPLTDLETQDLKAVVSARREEINQLLNSDIGQRLTDAEGAFRRLQHRRVLGGRMRDLRSFVERKRWANRAFQFLGSTRPITTKYNELFERLVTTRYATSFAQTLKRFKEDLSVGIETRGFKGETVRQIVLNPRTYRQAFSVDQVLSDGEKRAVAIADFLTEASMDESKQAIILDDPATFFDGQWKNELADCLTEMAKDRQVVIFTHDLAFLYRVKERSKELGVSIATHWIREEGGQAGFVYGDNSPVCEREYRSANKAWEYYAKAKCLDPAEQQSLLQLGFGALRTSYEALIIFDVFNEVVGRFEERISFGRLRQVCVDPALANDIVTRMEVLSRYIEAHLHSDTFASTKPTIEDLHREITSFETIRKKQQGLKALRN
jgi:recombinational DNA repair ATPase RecF